MSLLAPDAARPLRGAGRFADHLALLGMKALRDGVSPDALPGVPPDDFMKRLTRDAHYRGWTRDFLGG